ncbi:MAG: hypothetical protein E7358_07335 [Clostridiales bacterium]|nr:hypothetical protein [Clostridiales bacterium]
MVILAHFFKYCNFFLSHLLNWSKKFNIIFVPTKKNENIYILTEKIMYRLTENLPIGVYDSGIGGLCVLKELCKEFPFESFIYFGDNGNAPYGSKSVEEIKTLSDRAVKRLKGKKVKAIVIACNTISTHLYNHIKDTSALVIIKTFPPACCDKDACLLCTPLTSNSERVKSCFLGKVIACKNLAGDIERNVFDLSKVDLKGILDHLPNKTSKIILGCTHYYYIKREIEDITGLKVYSGFDEVKNELFFSLKNHSLLKTHGNRKVTFIGKFRKKNEKVYRKILLKTPKWSKK